eukprot:SAG11_NODE_9916_length_870_cov_1.198444_2_plen_104_part_00
MCLGPNGGAMVLGGNDPTLYEGPLHYLVSRRSLFLIINALTGPLLVQPLRSDSYYSVRATSIMMDDAYAANYVDVVIDSGTTLLLFPDTIWQSFWDHVIERCR